MLGYNVGQLQFSSDKPTQRFCIALLKRDIALQYGNGAAISEKLS